MPLDLTHLQTALNWSIERRSTPSKLANAKYIQLFNKHVRSTQNDYNGYIRYFELPAKTRSDHLVYIEGTPFFSLFKLTPNGYFIDYYQPDDYWKSAETDPKIIQRLLARNANKYIQTSDTIDLNLDRYILFPMQRPSLQIKLIEQCLQWAKDNKRHIVFKTHPMPVDEVDLMVYWSDFNNRGLLSKYSHLVDNVNTDVLVDNCEMVWTTNSGVGTQALLKGKAVAYFENDYDFTYGPIATFCKSVDDAANATISIDNVEKYFSWYYHKFAIDMQAVNYREKINQRFDMFYNRGYTVEQLFG